MNELIPHFVELPIIIFSSRTDTDTKKDTQKIIELRVQHKKKINLQQRIKKKNKNIFVN